MRTTLDDEALIAGVLAGGKRQENAIRQLYEQFFSLVAEGRRRHGTLSGEEALTAYHSAILSLRRELLGEQFRRESSLKTYLSKIFFNKCIDILRKKTSDKTAYPGEIPELGGERPEGLRRLVTDEQLRRAQGLLGRIGDVCRQIILDSEYWGYSAEEIAGRIGFSNAASVNSKKYTCLQQLRKLLGGAMSDGHE